MRGSTSRAALIDEAVGQARDGITPTVRTVTAGCGVTTMAMYRHLDSVDALRCATIETIAACALETSPWSEGDSLSVTLPIIANRLRCHPGILPVLNSAFLLSNRPLRYLISSGDDNIDQARTIYAALIAMTSHQTFSQRVDVLLLPLNEHAPAALVE